MKLRLIMLMVILAALSASESLTAGNFVWLEGEEPASVMFEYQTGGWITCCPYGTGHN